MAEQNQKNVYQKLQEARVILQEKNLKKSGRNKFSGYDYFELSDFLPTVNIIFSKLGLFSAIVFDEKQAVLTIYNTEKPEETISFTSPNADVSLKGCHPIQNIGAIETYQRRYLYITALEIVEADILDATTNTNISNEKKEIIKCDNCGEIIKQYKDRSVDDMVKGSLKAYGKKLCYKCCLDEKNKQKEGSANE